MKNLLHGPNDASHLGHLLCVWQQDGGDEETEERVVDENTTVGMYLKLCFKIYLILSEQCNLRYSHVWNIGHGPCFFLVQTKKLIELHSILNIACSNDICLP